MPRHLTPESALTILWFQKLITVGSACFLSHASADKDRFVRHFAEELTARGLRVWFDEWALLPGDSLVDKIFAEGLKDA